MYVFNQPRISVEEEETGIKSMIDEKYKTTKEVWENKYRYY